MHFELKHIVIFLSLVCPLVPACAAGGNIDLQYSDILVTNQVQYGMVKARYDQQNRAFIDVSEDNETAGPSTTKAMLLSLLMPGAGQYYAGSTTRGQVFMGVEAAIWAGFAAFRVYGGWKEDDYKAYAATFAGVQNEGKDDQFYNYIGFYQDREEYNQFSRLYSPTNPYFPDSPDFDWSWQSEAQREEFRDIRNQSKSAYRNATLMIGLAIANRVAAGIDTYRIVKKAQRKARMAGQFGNYKLKIKPKLFSDNPSIKISVTKKFF